MRVLIADDDRDLRSALASILTSGGHEVTACGTTSEAVAAPHGARFDAVVLDFHLADDTAETVLAVATRIEPAPLVILCSGSCDAGPVAQRWSVKFIAKPFGPERLLDCLAAAA